MKFSQNLIAVALLSASQLTFAAAGTVATVMVNLLNNRFMISLQKMPLAAAKRLTHQ